MFDANTLMDALDNIRIVEKKPRHQQVMTPELRAAYDEWTPALNLVKNLACNSVFIIYRDKLLNQGFTARPPGPRTVLRRTWQMLDHTRRVLLARGKTPPDELLEMVARVEGLYKR